MNLNVHSMDCCGIIVVRENFFQNCYGRDSLPPLRTIRFQLILIVVDSVIQSIPLICSNLKLISSKIKSKYKNKNSSSHLMASAPTNVRQKHGQKRRVAHACQKQRECGQRKWYSNEEKPENRKIFHNFYHCDLTWLVNEKKEWINRV